MPGHSSGCPPELQTQFAEKRGPGVFGPASRKNGSTRRRSTARRQADREPDEAQDPNVAAAVRDLESALGTRVRIVEKTDQRGRIEIEYYSQDDLNRIYEIINPAEKA